MRTGWNRRVASRILLALFLFFGVVELALWQSGNANDFALVLGVAYLFGVIVVAWPESQKKE